MTSSGNNNKKPSFEKVTVIAAVIGAIAAVISAFVGQGGIAGLFKGEETKGTKDTSPTITVNPSISVGGASVSTGNVTDNSSVKHDSRNETVSDPSSPVQVPNSSNIRKDTLQTRSQLEVPQKLRVKPPTNKAVSSPDITREEYDAIQNGMTYEQVTQIVGSPGKSDGTNGPFSFYKWDDGGHFGVRMTFLDGKLTSKGSYGFGL